MAMEIKGERVGVGDFQNERHGRGVWVGGNLPQPALYMVMGTLADEWGLHLTYDEAEALGRELIKAAEEGRARPEWKPDPRF